MVKFNKRYADFTNNCLRFIKAVCPRGYSYWLDEAVFVEFSEVSLQDHADIVYTLHLIGKIDLLSDVSAIRFQSALATANLHGRPTGNRIAAKGPNAHLTAYLLGAARLLDTFRSVPMQAELFQGWKSDILIDANFLPRWPPQWTHHIWRVSHWIGGIPSIMLQIAHSGQNSSINMELLDKVLDATVERLIDPRTGLLRPYGSQLIQDLFRKLYALRHDPHIGDIGGLVHVLWILHATSRPYVQNDKLLRSTIDMLEVERFIEKTPYCLDFDIIQLIRTAGNGQFDDVLKARISRFGNDVVEFLFDIPEGYTLHKLPGALATMHECAKIEGREHVSSLGIECRDVILDAYWI